MINKLSVIVPVYNEKDTIEKIMEAILSVPINKEILLVDDGSSDGTQKVIREKFSDKKEVRLFFCEKNAGKGNAIRTGIEAASGDAMIIQDADLEYDPMDYLRLIKILEEASANVVYGSRFMEKKKVTAFWHRFVNYFLTLTTNLLYFSHLTDMETCYKLFRSSLVKKLDLRSNGFEIEVELTAKTLKLGEKIREVPITYQGRSFHEGKKIGWKDGIKAFFLLFYYRVCD